MKLDLTSLEKAILSMQEAIDFYNDKVKEYPCETELRVIKSGVIQNFEFTYELCWKFIQRWLKINIGKDYVEGISRRELFRIARENKLIDDVNKWMGYHHARDETSHSYDSNKADEIFQISLKFLTDAKAVLKELKRRND